MDTPSYYIQYKVVQADRVQLRGLGQICRSFFHATNAYADLTRAIRYSGDVCVFITYNLNKALQN